MELQKFIQLHTGEIPLMCLATGLSRDGDFCENTFTVATKTRLLVVEQETVLYDFAFVDLQNVTAETGVGCGLLTAEVEGKSLLLCRFLPAHTADFATLAGSIKESAGKDFVPLKNKVEKPLCNQCGRPLQGSNTCPHCAGKKESFQRMFRICRPYLPRFGLIWLLMLATSGIALYQQEWIQHFVDDHIMPRNGTLYDVLWFVGVFFALIVIGLICNLIKQYLGVSLGSKMSGDLRTGLFLKIQNLPLSYYDSRKPGDLMNRIVGDTDTVRRFMENIFTNMVTYMVTFFGALILMFMMDWKLTLYSLVLVPIIWVIVRRFWRKIHRIFHVFRQKEDALNSGLQDVLQGMKVVKTFGTEEKEAQKFSRLSHDLCEIQQKNETFWAVFQPFIGILFNLGTLTVLLLGGIGTLKGTGFTVGEMAQYVAYAGMLFGPLGWFTNLPRMLMNLNVSLTRIDDIMARESDLPTPKHPVTTPIHGHVEFRDVTFGYHSYAPVLEHISFTVKRGEAIGLVGCSGAGKSTMINLIMRLYDVGRGEILLDGVPIGQYDPAYLHAQMGVVLQESYLFSGTVLDNIRFAKPNATMEEVIEAAKTAGAHDFITKFPMGYNTPVGESGQRLSGGERQRVAIARAVLNNPALLILDEATSALDTESEFVIQKALEQLSAGRTTFAIAHRLSTLKNCNRIFVIDNHQIVQIGSHKELMKQEGIYKDLVNAQLEMHAIGNPADQDQ